MVVHSIVGQSSNNNDTRIEWELALNEGLPTLYAQNINPDGTRGCKYRVVRISSQGKLHRFSGLNGLRGVILSPDRNLCITMGD